MLRRLLTTIQLGIARPAASGVTGLRKAVVRPAVLSVTHRFVWVQRPVTDAAADEESSVALRIQVELLRIVLLGSAPVAAAGCPVASCRPSAGRSGGSSWFPAARKCCEKQEEEEERGGCSFHSDNGIRGDQLKSSRYSARWVWLFIHSN